MIRKHFERIILQNMEGSYIVESGVWSKANRSPPGMYVSPITLTDHQKDRFD